MPHDSGQYFCVNAPSKAIFRPDSGKGVVGNDCLIVCIRNALYHLCSHTVPAQWEYWGSWCRGLI